MPKITLTSFGAAEQVTGSCHLLQAGNFKILVDCGFFQGDATNYQKNWEALDFEAKTLNAVILTHAHLDHCGRLPLLFRNKYRGKVYCTKATQQLTEIILQDNLRILQEKMLEQKLPPLYSSQDLKELHNSWQPLDYYQEIKLAKNISLKLHNAGHILGAAIAEIKIDNKTIVFSGDLGGENMPLVKNIDYLKQADYLIMESTYGDRQHEFTKQRNQKLLEAVQQVTIKHSTLLISVFAIERTQDILKILNDYYETHLDFRVPVFLDSPLAAQATKIYNEHLNLLNPTAQESLKLDKDIFSFPHLKITNHSRESKKINVLPPPKIILAGSGMAEGGRILHHLAQYLPNPKNHIVFMGFQVPGTLGWRLTNGAFDFDYYGKKIEIKATVEQIDAFSAHGDQSSLLKWLNSFQIKPKNIYLVHGNEDTMQKFSAIIKQKLNLTATPLKINQPVELY